MASLSSAFNHVLKSFSFYAVVDEGKTVYVGKTITGTTKSFSYWSHKLPNSTIDVFKVVDDISLLQAEAIVHEARQEVGWSDLKTQHPRKHLYYGRKPIVIDDATRISLKERPIVRKFRANIIPPNELESSTVK